MEKIKSKLLAMSAFALTGMAALAEGSTENPLAQVVTQAEDYINIGKTTVVTLLGAGLVIVAAFYVWRLIKKGISGAK